MFHHPARFSEVKAYMMCFRRDPMPFVLMLNIILILQTKEIMVYGWSSILSTKLNCNYQCI